MSDGLSPESRAVVDAFRGAVQRSPAARAQLRASLQARIAAGAPVHAAPGAPRRLWSSAWGKVFLAALVGGLGAGGLLAVNRVRREPAAHVAPVRAAPDARSTPVVAPLVDTRASRGAGESSEAPVAREPVAVDAGARVVEQRAHLAASRAAHGVAVGGADAGGDDGGDEEMRVTQEAGRAIDDGRFAAALAQLEAFARAHPRARLFADARAAERVLALCGIGRATEARLDAALFVRMHPRSPQLQRVRTSCAASVVGEDEPAVGDE